MKRIFLSLFCLLLLIGNVFAIPPIPPGSGSCTGNLCSVTASANGLTIVGESFAQVLASIGAAPAFTSGTANYFWATPNGSTGVPSLRAIVAADIPALSYAPVSGSANYQAASAILAALAGLTITVAGNDITVPGKIITTAADGSRELLLGNNTTYTPTASTYGMAYVGGLPKFNINATKYSPTYSADTTPIIFTTGGSTARTITVPDAAITLARIDAGQTFTGVNNFTSPVLTTPELIGEQYDVVTQSPTSTGTVTINLNTTSKAIITPGTATQTDTLAFSNVASSGKVKYVRIQIITDASHTVTVVWPTTNVSWIAGTSGTLSALTASKRYEYVCEVESTNVYCMILAEGI
jgi:hypothetical protein